MVVSYTNDFAIPELGAQTAQELISQGNNVIFGIAGSTGNGAILITTQFGMWAIGVDFDYYMHTFENGAVPGAEKLLTSTLKNWDVGVYDTISDTLVGAYTSGTVLYDLAQRGVGLAPFHDAEAPSHLD